MPAPIDISGQRFGKLVALRLHDGESRRRKWVCRCDCGTEKAIDQFNIRKGLVRSCGCLLHDPASNFETLIGQRFGRLKVVSRAQNSAAGQARWTCECDCGGTTVSMTTKLRSGHTQSCGCVKMQRIKETTTTHGFCADGQHHPLWHTYQHIIGRCYRETDRAYPGYGARGIRVCERWLNGDGEKTGVECFVADMGERPSRHHSIDRIDNDGDYEPGNCRWATRKEQARNRRSNRRVPLNGRMVALSEYCERKGLDFQMVNGRIGKGWTFERAVSQPKRAS